MVVVGKPTTTTPPGSVVKAATLAVLVWVLRLPAESEVVKVKTEEPGMVWLLIEVGGTETGT